MDENKPIIKIILFIMHKIELLFLKFGLAIIRTTPYLPRKRLMGMDFRAWDFNRYSSLELCAYEIKSKQVAGDVAELGVFQGTFASKINELFPDRKLYLFDTFEGFDNKDKTQESENDIGINIDFSSTSVNLVKGKMKYPDKCRFQIGYFPSTTSNLPQDINFAFVSIDADLYKPIYEGLCYFYPRLSKGGYIFIHDYNNLYFSSANEAVKKFCQEFQVGVFPLSDVGGTAVITK